ncbi:putative malate dehydrogenase 1B [Leptopilina boulardi]|uniref:putative malate dehydrogenase 1B n=1 Tax=Leptopilina boulardi TaxID=63433 RepID=UPI0021F5F37D|nr:putative malate dehydrogenase 1B [Leptopilina boulardi]
MDLDKITTVVAGYSEDLALNHVCYVADNLSQILPNFSFIKICVDRSKWKEWLHEICKKNNWSHRKSPLIWREYNLSNDRQYYIGGATEFWEFVYEYYGVNSRLSKKELEALKKDTTWAQSKDASLKCSEEEKNKSFSITVIGAGRSACPDLIAQIITLKELSTKAPGGIILNVYDELSYFLKIKDMLTDILSVGGTLRSTNILKNVSDGLKNCDLLIILEHLKIEDMETIDSWLMRNYESTLKLAKNIKEHSPPHMKVIFCTMGPACFCASIIAKVATNLNKSNIVVVSTHYGLEMLYDFVKSLDVEIKNVGCPPVWGYLGINHYVDVDHVVEVKNIFLSNNIANGSKSSAELRWLFYLTYDKKPFDILLKRKTISFYEVGRTEDFQKCKALCDLLKLWFGYENEDDIISLGIYSDGTFGIPEGIYFSQPVYLKKIEDNSFVWSPCIEFPKPNLPSGMFENLVTTATIIERSINSKDAEFVFKNTDSETFA